MTSKYSKQLIKSIDQSHDKINWTYLIDAFPNDNDGIHQLIQDLTDNGHYQCTYDFKTSYAILNEINKEIHTIEQLINDLDDNQNINVETDMLMDIIDRLKELRRIKLQCLIERFVDQNHPNHQSNDNNAIINPTRNIMESPLFIGI